MKGREAKGLAVNKVQLTSLNFCFDKTLGDRERAQMKTDVAWTVSLSNDCEAKACEVCKEKKKKIVKQLKTLNSSCSSPSVWLTQPHYI